MEKLTAVDPPDCGCTSCILGSSKPINFCNDEEIKALYKVRLENRSGREVEKIVTYRVKKEAWET